MNYSAHTPLCPWLCPPCPGVFNAHQTVGSKFEGSTNEETRRMVELAKEKEQRTAASMGYNPFEARMMGNNVSAS